MHTKQIDKFLITKGAPVTYLVQIHGRPSMKELVKHLQNKIAETATLPVFVRGVPIAMSVTYTVGGAGWGVEKESIPLLWHLNLPRSTLVAEMCAEVLCSSGAIHGGQLVHAEVSKLLGAVERSQLEVELQPLYPVCRPDMPKRTHKLLAWFIARAEANGRKPTKKGFYALLRSLVVEEGEESSEETKEAVKALFESSPP